MDLDDIKRGLRAEIKKRENEQYATFQCNVRQMCKDVLAKLEEQESEIAELKAQKAQAEDDCAYWKMNEGNAANAMHETEEYAMPLYKEAQHHKYRRCLAMAEWCEATALWCYQAANTLPTGFHATLYGKRVMIEPDRLFKRHVLLTKWSARWRELAEKFKEVK
jgi:hypothetical protein